ncbi:MAG: hypothetical protein AAGF12_28820, partial [Myxococcota bacterium]
EQKPPRDPTTPPSPWRHPGLRPENTIDKPPLRFPTAYRATGGTVSNRPFRTRVPTTDGTVPRRRVQRLLPRERRIKKFAAMLARGETL